MADRGSTITLGDAGRLLRPASFGTMVKPAGSACNLGCTYCYYLEKAALYGGRERVMDEDLLEAYIKQYFEANESDEVSFCWHGGEPLLLGIEYFRKALALQKKYADGRRVLNSLQTNGTKVNDAWCRFFHTNGFLVGISLDGPRDIQDHFRRTSAGAPTFDSVMAAISLFKRYGVEFNTLSVVNSLCEGRGAEIYRFFRDEVGSHYMQFLPAANRDLPWAVSGKGYGQFLNDVFDEWIKRDVGQYYVHMFDATLSRWCGLAPGVCTINEVCSDSLTVEHNGDVYPCDHFVSPQTLLGNIREKSLKEIFDSKPRIDFSIAKRDSLPRECRRCEWLFTCFGECPEHRVDGKNVLCEGLKAYFSHVARAMDRMRDLLAEGKAPALIMNETTDRI
ncbi:MAG: anaerobic sulfatase maturase [Bacteroidales bacterium]|nr:anaerobic sulfatase maturase [Bacteroidales bacterium]